MPGKDEPFGNAPDPKKAFENARDGKALPANDAPQQESPQTKDQPVMRPRPGGPMREMANEVDRMVQHEVQIREAEQRKAGKIEDAPERDGRKPRRVTQLARAFNREKDKSREP